MNPPATFDRLGATTAIAHLYIVFISVDDCDLDRKMS
jgi:hypothetical protein